MAATYVVSIANVLDSIVYAGACGFRCGKFIWTLFGCSLMCWWCRGFDVLVVWISQHKRIRLGWGVQICVVAYALSYPPGK